MSRFKTATTKIGCSASHSKLKLTVAVLILSVYSFSTRVSKLDQSHLPNNIENGQDCLSSAIQSSPTASSNVFRKTVNKSLRRIFYINVFFIFIFYFIFAVVSSSFFTLDTLILVLNKLKWRNILIVKVKILSSDITDKQKYIHLILRIAELTI